MRFRVIFAEREAVEVEANQFEFTAAGGLVLTWVETTEQYQQTPQGMVKMRIPVSTEVRGAWSRDARWVEIQDITAESDPEPASDPIVAPVGAVPILSRGELQ